MIPLCAMFIAALIPGVGLGTYAYPAMSVAEDELARIKVHFTIWISCSFALDLAMTATTVVYLWRTRTGLKEHSNVFTAVWTVLWVSSSRLFLARVCLTSAAPPLILMFIAIVDGYMTKLPSHPSLIVAVDIAGKFFVLSVMINLCGRNLIQEKLSRSAKTQSGNSRNQGGLGVSTIPVMIRQEKTTEYELNEWPVTLRSPRMEVDHRRIGSHSEEMEAKDSGNELVVEVHPEQIKQHDLVISEELRLSSEQRLGHYV
ncbi:unnamed protein product [Rhizoctonia solani]|uniref:Uncharacterized protein n=1 Tax=Rhizoctonia solani TaxID=456999 RepID=A0A8H3DR81_9AGAM|nr:unnamed protein product [Rhizoctonia solani]